MKCDRLGSGPGGASSAGTPASPIRPKLAGLVDLFKRLTIPKKANPTDPLWKREHMELAMEEFVGIQEPIARLGAILFHLEIEDSAGRVMTADEIFDAAAECTEIKWAINKVMHGSIFQDPSVLARLRGTGEISERKLTANLYGIIAAHEYKDRPCALDSAFVAVLLDPENASHWFTLAKALRHNCRLPKARRAINVALSLDPTNSEMREFREKVTAANTLAAVRVDAANRGKNNKKSIII